MNGRQTLQNLIRLSNIYGKRGSQNRRNTRRSPRTRRSWKWYSKRSGLTCRRSRLTEPSWHSVGDFGHASELTAAILNTSCSRPSSIGPFLRSPQRPVSGPLSNPKGITYQLVIAILLVHSACSLRNLNFFGRNFITFEPINIFNRNFVVGCQNSSASNSKKFRQKYLFLAEISRFR